MACEKYNIGDKVWIKETLEGKYSDGFAYNINYNRGEEDIRGKLVTITGYRYDDKSSNAYKCNEYSGFTDDMLDVDKMFNGVSPDYEIY